jgi:hypothetical protein
MQYGNLKVHLQNDFTTGDRQTLHLLDKYSKTLVAKATQSEGNSFAQRGGRGDSDGKNNDSSTYDKKWWKNEECNKCHKKGHPSMHCPKKSDKDDDNRSLARTSSSVDKLKKDLKSMKKSFTKVNTQLMLIPQVRPEHKYPISPWEMIHPPGGDYAVCR